MSHSIQALYAQPCFAGMGFPKDTDPILAEFLRTQAPGAKYVMSVCSGSWHLAAAGLLDGLKATTNKAFFRFIEV